MNFLRRLIPRDPSFFFLAIVFRLLSLGVSQDPNAVDLRRLIRPRSALRFTKAANEDFDRLRDVGLFPPSSLGMKDCEHFLARLQIQVGSDRKKDIKVELASFIANLSSLPCLRGNRMSMARIHRYCIDLCRNSRGFPFPSISRRSSHWEGKTQVH